MNYQHNTTKLTRADLVALMTKPAIAQWEATPPIVRLVGVIECGSVEQAIARLALHMFKRAIRLN